MMGLKQLSNILLNEASSPAQLRDALSAFTQRCSEVGGIVPDRSFNALAGDALLKDGVAISPAAAATALHYAGSEVAVADLARTGRRGVRFRRPRLGIVGHHARGVLP